jgi:hypothetical protein
MKNLNDSIGNQTCDLSAYSTVPQPTELPGAPACFGDSSLSPYPSEHGNVSDPRKGVSNLRRCKLSNRSAMFIRACHFQNLLNLNVSTVVVHRCHSVLLFGWYPAWFSKYSCVFLSLVVIVSNTLYLSATLSRLFYVLTCLYWHLIWSWSLCKVCSQVSVIM